MFSAIKKLRQKWKTRRNKRKLFSRKPKSTNLGGKNFVTLSTEELLGIPSEKALGNLYNELNEAEKHRTNLLGLYKPKTLKTERKSPPLDPNIANLFKKDEPFEAGIFFDNHGPYGDDVKAACPGKFRTPKVTETHGSSRNYAIPVPSKEYDAFVMGLSQKGKDAANVIARFIMISSNDRREYLDKKSGIDNVYNKNHLEDWIKEQREAGKKRLVAIFDFDRTLTQMEGGFFLAPTFQQMKKEIHDREAVIEGKRYSLIPYFNHKTGNNEIYFHPITESQSTWPYLPKFTLEGYAEYLAGSKTRFEELKSFFKILYDEKIQCFILTNNKACPVVRPLFEEIAKVYTDGHPIPVICGLDFPKPKQKPEDDPEGDKGKAVLGKEGDVGALAALRGMCIPPRNSTRRTRRS